MARQFNDGCLESSTLCTLDLIKCRHTFKIDGISELKSITNGALVSWSELDLKPDWDNPQSKPTLTIGVNHSSQRYLQFSFTPKCQTTLPMSSATYSLSVIKNNASKHPILGETTTAPGTFNLLSIQSPTLAMTTLESNMAEFCPDGVLTIVFEAEFNIWMNRDTPINNLVLSNTSLNENLGAYYTNRDFSDVVFKTKDRQTIYGHKVILAAASPFFKKLIMNSIEDEDDYTTNITLDNINAETLKKIFLFLYVGQIPAESIDLKLLEAAVELQLSCLVSVTLETLPELLTVNNAAEAIAAAFNFNLEELYDICINFFLKNVDKVMSSEGWKDKIESNPALISKVVRELATKPNRY